MWVFFKFLWPSQNEFYTYSRLRNKHRGTLINFWTFFQGLHSLLGRVMHIFFQNIRYFMVWGMPFLGLRLMFLPNSPWAMFTPGATSNSKSRVLISRLILPWKYKILSMKYFCYSWIQIQGLWITRPIKFW